MVFLQQAILSMALLGASAGLAARPDTSYQPNPPDPNCAAAYGWAPGKDPLYSRPAKEQPDHNLLYDFTQNQQWHIAGKGRVHTMGFRKVSVSKGHTVEEFWTGPALAPSPAWLQVLQETGRIPDPYALIASLGPYHTDLLNFLFRQELLIHQSPDGDRFLSSQRRAFMNAVRPGFDLALREDQRRAWNTKEFRRSAAVLFDNALENSSFLLVRRNSTQAPVAGIRFIHIHNGLLQLRHVESDRILRIVGNAEYTWGFGDRFVFDWPSIQKYFEVKDHVQAFLEAKSGDQSVFVKNEPREKLQLPTEISLKVELPRNYQKMKISEKDNPTARILGEDFVVEFSHAALVEPGLYAIPKTDTERTEHFQELVLWMQRYLENPPLPKWIDRNEIGYWTYNDLPLYLRYGFEQDTSFGVKKKYGVDWKIYSGRAPQMSQSLRQLFKTRGAKTKPREAALGKYLK